MKTAVTRLAAVLVLAGMSGVLDAGQASGVRSAEVYTEPLEAMVAGSRSAALVAQGRYVLDAPGRWKPWTFTAYPDDVRALGARPADLKAVEAQLLRLNAIIKGTPGFSNPIGFSVGTSGLLDFPREQSSAAFGPALTVRPLPARLAFGPFGIQEFGSGAAATRDDSGETQHIYFVVNHLGQALFASADTRVPEFDDLATDVARLVPPQPDAYGLPRYGDTLVLKKSAEPIWTAVTLAETLELATRGIEQRLAGEREVVARVQSSYDDMKDPSKREQRMAQYRKIEPLQKDPAYIEKMSAVEDQKAKLAETTLLPQIAAASAVVARTEQELAAAKATRAGLSAADQAAPACYAGGDAASLSRFRRAVSAGCDPLVRPNWKVFNPALPRSAPQVLIIATSCLRAGPTPQWAHGCTANRRLLESLDKAALLAWLQ
jgi:hypothetical protein